MAQTSAQQALNGVSRAQHVDQYLRWATKTAAYLRPVLDGNNLSRLLLTPRFWATQTNPRFSSQLVTAVTQELHERAIDLEAALAALTVAERWWSDPRQPYVAVIDTNIYLHSDREIGHLPWRELLEVEGRLDRIRVVVPLLVVDELDKAKLRNNVQKRAKDTLKSLYSWFKSNPDGLHELPSPTDHGRVTVELMMDGPGHVRLDRADDELIERAAALQRLRNGDVQFVTFDTGAAFRAEMAELVVHRLEQP
jgi:hypothetical protein